jgi:TolB-like protein
MSHDFAFGPFILDMQRGKLIREGQPIGVSSKGLRLLEALLGSPGRVLTKTELMRAAWGDTAIEESNLSVQIAALRKQLGPTGDGGNWITTIPRVGYRFALPAQVTTEGIANAGSPPIEREHRPSIVVLPFANLSGEKEHEYLADGITEDIITALTRFRWFFVIGRNSSFAYKGKSLDAKQLSQELGVRYLLEGSLRKSGQHIRISAQLVDATSGNHIWAERYDLELTELFAIQDAIAERVAGAIEPELLRTEGAHAVVARHTGNMTAWDLVRRGTWHFHQVTRENHPKARELFRQACSLDPELPEAHLWLGRVSAGLVAYGWSDNPIADLQEGVEAALKAVQLDERNPYSHYALAMVSVYSDRFEQSIGAARKAIEISPLLALGHLVLGMGLLFSGRATEAIASLEYGLRLSPYDPQNFVWFNLLALARLFSGRAEAALEAAARALQVRPNWWTSLEVLVCCYAALGKWDEARRCTQQMDCVTRQSGAVLAPLKSHNPRWADEMNNALQKACG